MLNWQNCIMTEALVSLPSISNRSSCETGSSIYNRSTSRPTTQARDAPSQPSSLGSNETRSVDHRRECLTSLSALYRSSYKPYQFTHMYGTHYNKNFQGRIGQPPALERQTTARHAPINYSSLKTTYQQEFRDREPMGKPLIIPSSRNRKNKPHPNLTNTWKYPNSFRWIWSENTPAQSGLGTVHEDPNEHRKTKSAGFFSGKTKDARTHRWCSR